MEGRVQGVFYRAWTVETARAMALDGWVRNRPDGTVEIFAAGPEAQLEALIAACRHGPPAAQVERVAAEPADPEEAPSPFEKRPTG